MFLIILPIFLISSNLEARLPAGDISSLNSDNQRRYSLNPTFNPPSLINFDPSIIEQQVGLIKLEIAEQRSRNNDKINQLMQSDTPIEGAMDALNTEKGRGANCDTASFEDEIKDRFKNKCGITNIAQVCSRAKGVAGAIEGDNGPFGILKAKQENGEKVTIADSWEMVVDQFNGLISTNDLCSQAVQENMQTRACKEVMTVDFFQVATQQYVDKCNEDNIETVVEGVGKALIAVMEKFEGTIITPHKERRALEREAAKSIIALEKIMVSEDEIQMASNEASSDNNPTRAPSSTKD